MTNSAKRVLVVDDFDDSRFSLSKLLEIEGYEVIEATDGVQAIEKALQDKPDLILMDLSLPLVDGLSATRQIRQSDEMKRVPIIALTAHAIQGDRERCLAAGMDAYVSKPIRADLLFASLAEVTGSGSRDAA